MPPCRWYLYRSVTHTQRCTFTSTPSCLAKPPPELVHLKSLNGEEEHRLARSWVVDFGPDDIPKKSYETSYARSSGPGGQVCSLCLHMHQPRPRSHQFQHVNTTSSKAVVRLPLSPALGTWLPRYIMSEVQKSVSERLPCTITSNELNAYLLHPLTYVQPLSTVYTLAALLPPQSPCTTRILPDVPLRPGKPPSSAAAPTPDAERRRRTPHHRRDKRRAKAAGRRVGGQGKGQEADIEGQAKSQQGESPGRMVAVTRVDERWSLSELFGPT